MDKANTQRLILDTSAAPVLDGATMPTLRFLQASWSPRGMLFYERCLLATLTSLGAVSVEYMLNHSWVVLADISAYWISHCHHSWKPLKTGRTKPEEQANRLRERAYQLKTTCIAWSKLFGESDDGYCFLATAQKGGTIVVWRIVRTMGGHTASTPPFLLLTWNTQIETIQAMRWFATSGNSIWLVVSALSGTVEMWQINIDSGTVTEQAVSLWLEKDLMRVACIVECAPPEPASSTEFFLVFSKANFIIGVLVDVADSKQVAVRIHAHRLPEGEIRGMQPIRGASLAVATEKAEFFYFTFRRPASDKLDCSVQAAHSNINTAHMACYGLVSSRNHIIWAVPLCVNKSYDHLILRHPTSTTFFMFTSNEGLPLLVENPRGSLALYRDCLESVRLNHLAGEPPPPADVDENELEQLSDYQLRLTLWFATISDLRPPEDVTVRRPSKIVSPSRIQMLLFARHAFARMQRILASAVNGGELTQLDLMSIHLLRAWVLQLRHICKSENSPAHAHAVNIVVWPTVASAADKILAGSNGLEDLIRETCNVCGEEIESNKDKGAELEAWRFAVCRKGHRTGRCSASLVQLSIPYYTCSFCKVVVHNYFVSSAKPVCIYCDGVLRADERV